MAKVKKRKQETAGIPYIAAASARQFPKPSRQEIVFVGRSNVGKSTLVNALSKRKNLARTSKTPGKTRLVFFYDVSPGLYFVDVPGYGYAKASGTQQEAFSKVTNEYFDSKRPIALVLLLLDIRRGLGPTDLQMLDYLCHHDMDWQVVLTKADKLSRQAALAAERQVMETMEELLADQGIQAYPPLSVSAGLSPLDERMQKLERRIRERTGGA